MAVYKLKLTLQDGKDFYRIIEINDDQTFSLLHRLILKSVEFEEGELASFYLNYQSRKERVEICLSEMQKDDDCLLMKNVKIKDIVTDKVKELTYIYDFLNMWTFNLEILSTKVVFDKNAKYPRLVESFGNPPKQDAFPGFDLENMNDADLAMMKDLMDKNDDYFDRDSDFAELDNLEEYDDLDKFDDDSFDDKFDDSDLFDDKY